MVPPTTLLSSRLHILGIGEGEAGVRKIVRLPSSYTVLLTGNVDPNSPTAVCLAAQFLTAGVALPVYFISHILSVPALTKALPTQHLSHARTVFAAVVLGYLVPSTFLLYIPRGASVDDVQIIAAIWQPFPLYIAAAWTIFRALDTRMDRLTDRAHTLNWLRQTYFVCGVLSGIFHLRVMIPALLTTEPAHSFANVFVPFWMHSYLPLSVPSTPTIAPSSFYPLTLYRPAMRLLFQHDWLTMTLAALVFFGWHHRAALGALRKEGKRDMMSFRTWVGYMIGISAAGGPGAAIAWAAVRREETLFAYAAEIMKAD